MVDDDEVEGDRVRLMPAYREMGRWCMRRGAGTGFNDWQDVLRVRRTAGFGKIPPPLRCPFQAGMAAGNASE